MNTVLNVENLSKIFHLSGRRKLTALDQVSFSMQPGEVMAVLGPNGSGKSTLFKCILGYLKPETGRVNLFGRSLEFNQVREGLGFLFEKVSFYPELTPVELMTFYGRILGLKSKDIANEIDKWLSLVDLLSFKSEPVGNFSKGMVQRVGLAVSLLGDPPLLILDEPTSGLDIFGIYKMQSILSELKKGGKTLLISSHNISHIQAFTDTYLVLKKGKVVWLGASQASPSQDVHVSYRINRTDESRFRDVMHREQIPVQQMVHSAPLDDWLKSFYE